MCVGWCSSACVEAVKDEGMAVLLCPVE